jgi:hypothetical protein
MILTGNDGIYDIDNRSPNDTKRIHEIWDMRILTMSNGIYDEIIINNIPYSYPYNFKMISISIQI